MLEAYQALADYSDVMTLVEEVFVGVTENVLGSTKVTFQGRELDLSPPFRRASMTSLVSERLGQEIDLDTGAPTLQGLARGAGVEVEDGWSAGRVIAELYEELVEGDIWQPTFVTHPPIEVSPLARRNPVDPRLADRFELVIAGSEYANAFSELNDPDDQRERFLTQAAARDAGDHEAHPVDEDYLLALEYGLPPTGGLGIGVDRLVMLLTDQPHIREVILFPTMRSEAES
jgi:lysyl-tRNA synthetase class 2